VVLDVLVVGGGVVVVVVVVVVTPQEFERHSPIVVPAPIGPMLQGHDGWQV
jgi:hypothetical protein